ncbi:MAG: 30S ribosomal protein S9, partial [Candidatus Margulisbacteria bacterium]|nr:30S ribosomal protein S9 [Candidatus Margulisiibacteriota bacterium]
MNISLTQRTKLMKPLLLTKTNDRYDVIASVNGGGISGQVDAVMYGIAKGLNVVSEEYRTILKGEGLLTRDDRIVERKKYGKKKARKGTQYRKR